MAVNGHARSGGTSRASGRVLTAVTASASAVVLAACTASNGHSASRSRATPAAKPSRPASSSAAASLAAEITSLPAGGATRVNPGKPFVVKVAHGTLDSVVMTNSTGRHVRGSMNASHTSWTTAEALGYAKTYTVRSVAHNADGKSVRSHEKISTVTPANQTSASIVRIGNYALKQGKKYGVAIVPVVHFDEPVYNFRAAEKAMSVQTSPHVAGAWYWSDHNNAHWRPQHWWKPGTKVTVNAKVYGVRLARGLYGSSDVSRSFVIGRKQVTIADDNAPRAVDKVRVYDGAGRLLRTMNTSMGKHGGTQTSNGYINFYTLDGTYTVLDHENPAKMCSASYGLPADAAGGYACENIPWSTKISIDGIYLHELRDTEWAQNSGVDVSHGCLNLSARNAKWYFNHSMDGDPVVVHGKKAAPTLQVWQGGDWTVPWHTWAKGGVAA